MNVTPGNESNLVKAELLVLVQQKFISLAEPMLQLGQRNHFSHTTFFLEQANLSGAAWVSIRLNSSSADLQVCQTVIKYQFMFYLHLLSLQCLQLYLYSKHSSYPSI